MRKLSVAAASCAVALTAVGITLARQGEAPAKPAGQAGNGRGFSGDMLVEGLKSTPGCLGVEIGRMQSGKQVIFGFFENKKAVMNWYNHPMHARLRTMVPGFDPNREPMEHVPETGPVVAVASISFDGKPAVEGSQIPFSQIAIELYSPISGGLEIGGGFAPAGFKALVDGEAKAAN